MQVPCRCCGMASASHGASPHHSPAVGQLTWKRYVVHCTSAHVLLRYPCDVPVVDSAVIRCPGRFFAEMELVLLVLMVLQRLQLTPEDLSSHHKPRGHEQHNRTAGCNKVVKSILAGGGKAVSRLLPSFLVSWGYDLAIFGAGLFKGSRLQAGTWFGSAGQWQSLPPPDLLRLVGFKVPQGTWWVRVQ